ncbi:hypothetical protein BpHYR1_031419 [Brachionus plicatilis]|uniref:Uncharacterized protein n=1 Tax=Brachionus plicatilis TaxID=10195 RepID=A0A3M7RHP5_BRAPC|nr:hypothetical protein BpHYR1_031419 [Brachionus plicatilis]
MFFMQFDFVTIGFKRRQKEDLPVSSNFSISSAQFIDDDGGASVAKGVTWLNSCRVITFWFFFLPCSFKLCIFSNLHLANGPVV